MKKVLLLVHDLAVGGVSTSLINVTKLLIGNGCEVTIKTTSSIYNKNILERIDSRAKVEILDEKRHPFLENLRFFRNFYESGMWTTRTSAKKVYKHFVRKSERGQYDIEIAFYFGRPVKAICGSSNKNSRKIMWIRLGFLDNGNFAGFRTQEDAVNGFKYFDKIIGVSEDVADDFVKHTGIDDGRVVSIHNYLDKDNIDRCLREPCDVERKVFTISYVCRLVPIKNVMALVHVVERLQKEGLDCACWFIGDGPLRSEIEEYIKEHNVQNVEIMGYQTNPHKFVNASDLYVSTSLMEGYPNTLADSMYIGTPIVSTRCVGAPNILRDGKYGILTDFDEESIYQGIKKMMTEKNVYNHYKAVIKSFDFEKEAEHISADLLNVILGE